EHEGHDHAEHGGHDHAEHGGHDHAEHEGHDHAPPLIRGSILDYPDQEITSLLLRFRNHGYQALNMQRNINENTDLQAATPAIEINRLYDMMGVGTQALRVLALVIILVSALSVFIALFSSLKERRYELALMRVMGASRGTLFFLLLAEGVLLAGLGCLLGLLLSHGGMGLLAAYLEEAYRYPFSGWLFLPKEFQLIFASIAIGILAALLPAFQASRTDISDTLTAS
ncbi:MAG: FtsX-like permease family protein, partial [Bacteroidota bacterium]